MVNAKIENDVREQTKDWTEKEWQALRAFLMLQSNPEFLDQVRKLNAQRHSRNRK